MSGISAQFRFDGSPVAAPALDAMVNVMHGWGGGATSSWVARSGRAGLGVRIMAVTPEDRYDRQPLTSRDGNLSLVADARIDNRPELASALGIGAAAVSEMSDSELLLASWEAWGEQAPTRLLGDFAFLIWDERRQALHAVRDQVGQRVLFYHRSSRFIALASSPAALLVLPDVPRALDLEKIGELLVLLEDPERTCLAGVVRIAPAHMVRVTPEGVSLTRYWDPRSSRPIRFRSDAAYLEAFRDVMGRAVRDRVRSSSLAAVSLSAGLDSTTVAALAVPAVQSEGRSLLAFHAAPPLAQADPLEPRSGWVADESADVEAVAGMYPNLDLTILRGPWRTPLEDAVRLFEALFAPVRNPVNLGWYSAVYEAARAGGATVLLTGGRGNHTISASGARWLVDLARRGRVLRLSRELRALAKERHQRLGAALKYWVLLPLMPRGLLGLYYRLRGTDPGPPLLETTLSPIRPEFARELRLEERYAAAGQDQSHALRWGLGEAQIAGVTGTGDGSDVPHGLRARFGIETREPASDVRVIEFCLGLPGSQYLRAGKERQLVRRAMAGRLPPAILERTSRGAQAADWNLWFGRMREDMAAELDALQRIDAARRCLDLKRMGSLLAEWPGTLRAEHFNEYGLRLLRGVMMGRFIRWFTERSP